MVGCASGGRFEIKPVQQVLDEAALLPDEVDGVGARWIAVGTMWLRWARC